MKKSSISRRNFLVKAATVGVAGIMVPSIVASCARETKKIVPVATMLDQAPEDRFLKPVLLVVAVVEQVQQLTF